jgi:hypothetical protein
MDIRNDAHTYRETTVAHQFSGLCGWTRPEAWLASNLLFQNKQIHAHIHQNGSQKPTWGPAPS